MVIWIMASRSGKTSLAKALIKKLNNKKEDSYMWMEM